MVNTTTLKGLEVSNGGDIRPHIRLPYSQLDEVQQLLDQHGIRYEVDDNILSLNGAPANALINLGRAADVKSIQNILDCAT